MPIPGFQDRTMGEFKISFDHGRNLWISSRGVGAFMQPHGSDEIISFYPAQAETHGYRNVYGLEAMTDKYGNVWFAGPQLHYMPASGKSIKNISSKGNITIALYADDDQVLFGAEQPYQWDKATTRTTPFWIWDKPANIRGSNRTRKPRLYGFTTLDESRVVIASSRNIYIWNRFDNTISEYPSKYGGPFRDIVLDQRRQCLWICGNQGVPIIFDLNTREFSRRQDMSEIRYPHSVAIDTNGIVWFGTWRQGMYSFDPETGETRNFSPDSPGNQRLSSLRVNDIEIGADGNLWIATSLGLNHMSPGSDSIVIYRIDQPGLESDLVHSVISDNTGKIWMGTGDGLSVFDPETKQFRHFAQEDGLLNSYYMERACYKDNDGTLYFGGNQGVDYFRPAEMGKNDIPPDIYVSAIRVNDKDYKTDSSLFKQQRIELTYDQNFVEVELLALHFTAPHANRYAYRITELHDQWIDLGQRRIVSLANSSPGTFTIEAKAANADDVWCSPKTLLTIEIAPPFYQTWWFIATCIFLLAAILYAAYRYRISQIRKEERLKTEFEKQIANLEMKALRAQMNPHFLFNSLNSIKSLISAGETDKASEYVTRFSQLIRQVLANSQKPVVRLQEDLNALRLYMEIERLRFQNFNYAVEVTDGVNADFIEIPPLLLQPYVENAIWHGLLHKTDGDRNVNVRVSNKKGYLVMEVEDNGIGRERANRIKMRGSRKGGLGMKITGDRIRILKDYFGQEANVEVVDLVNNDGSAGGTLVRVTIPVQD